MTQTRTLPWKALWVSVLISVAVALARFIGQVQGWIDTSSGGGLHPLGVSWLPFVFGPVFARRLARTGRRHGHTKRPRWAWSGSQ